MGEKQRPGIMIYFDQYEPVSGFSYNALGRLLDASMRYAKTGEAPELSGMAAVAWGYWRANIDRDEETYRKKCEKASRAARARWDAREQADLPEEQEPLPDFERERAEAPDAARDSPGCPS